MEGEKKDLELYCKASPDGTQVGDCPFAHYIRCIIHYKKLDCEVHPCTKQNKPDWLINDCEGKMPCIRHQGKPVTESSVIAEYLDSTFPSPPLRFNGKEVEAMERVADVFPALAKFVKTKEFDVQLEANLLGALQRFEEFRSETNGPFLLADQLSLADFSLAPKLYVMSIALKTFRPDTYAKLDQFPKVKEYMDGILNHETLVATKYPEEYAVFGWTQAREASS